MLAAIAIILGMFSINVGSTIRIGFSGIPNGVCAYLFGPVVGGIFAGGLDVLKYLLKPAGPFFPGLTAVVILAGVLYGCFYSVSYTHLDVYKRQVHIRGGGGRTDGPDALLYSGCLKAVKNA